MNRPVHVYCSQPSPFERDTINYAGHKTTSKRFELLIVDVGTGSIKLPFWDSSDIESIMSPGFIFYFVWMLITENQSNRRSSGCAGLA